MRIIAIADSASAARASPLKARLAKPSASSPASSRFDIIGTNAALRAPSAKIRRNMLGRRKAATKASISMPGPMSPAISTSRTKPVTRLASVQPPTVSMPGSRRIGLMGRPFLTPSAKGYRIGGRDGSRAGRVGISVCIRRRSG